jgi:hypothetical protein
MPKRSAEKLKGTRPVEAYQDMISTEPIALATGSAVVELIAEIWGGYAQRERGRLRAERLRAPDDRNTVTGLGA